MNADDFLLSGLIGLVGAVLACLARLRQWLRRGRKAGWLALLAGNFLIFALLASLTILAGEIYFRWFYDTTDSFVQTKVSRQWFERHWHENASGIRDDMDYASRRMPGRRRITFVGDSFTAGQGVSRVGDRFANRLRQQHPEWEVHLLAFPGFDSGGQVDYLRDVCARGYELDDVVLVYCLNDLSDLIPGWMSEVANFQVQWEQRSWLRQHSYLFDTLAYRTGLGNGHGPQGYFDFVQSAYTNAVWKAQATRLEEFHRVAAGRGGRLLVATFPFMHCLGKDYPFSEVHSQLAAFWNRQGVAHLDLLPAFRNQQSITMVVNPRDAHPNERAHAIAAEAITAFLKSTPHAVQTNLNQH